MDPIQIGLIALVGGVVSHLFNKSKLAKLRRAMVFRHMQSMTALADAAVEVMAVDYGADLKECMTKLYAKAMEMNPHLMGLDNPAPTPDMYARIEQLRKEKHGDKKPD